MKGTVFALLLTTTPCLASVTYDFIGQGYFPEMSLVVTNQAVQSGVLNGTVVSQESYGDLSGFETFSMSGPYPQTFSSDLMSDYGTLGLDLLFNPDGTLSGSLRAWGRDEDVTLSGIENTWTGTWNYDISGCGSLGCPLVGTFVDPPSPVSVPEVSSLLLLLSGLLFLKRRLT